MQLVPALIDFPKARHKHADLLSFLMGSLWEHTRDMTHWRFRQVWSQMLGDVKDAWLAHGLRVSQVKRNPKIGNFTP